MEERAIVSSISACRFSAQEWLRYSRLLRDAAVTAPSMRNLVTHGMRPQDPAVLNTIYTSPARQT